MGITATRTTITQDTARSICIAFLQRGRRIVLDAEKEIESVQIEAVANDVILGVAGISIARSN